MFDKVQKPSDSSSDWSPARLQKQDNFREQPQQEKPSSFSMPTKGEDTWSLDDDPLLSRWKKEEAAGETQPIAMANAVAQKEDTKTSSETKAGLEQSLAGQQTDEVETNHEVQKSQQKSVKSKKSSLSSQERFALADVIQQLLGFFKPLGEFVAGAVYQWLYHNGEPARWLLQTLIPEWNGLERDVEQGLPKSWTFEAGRSLGDGLALVTGILEIVGGGGAAAGGGTLCVTGVGCIAGAPAVAGGVALGLHGSATSSSALTSIAARLGVVFHSATNNSPENNNAENANIGERSETWGVDPATRAADEAAGVIVNGSYIKNPTARKLADIVTESGKIGSKQMTGQFMYVVDELGNIIIGTRAGQRMPHPTLIGGKNPRVLAAGIVDIRGGKIYSVNNASGHFKPGANSLEAARESFTKLPNKLFHKNFQGFKPYDQ